MALQVLHKKTVDWKTYRRLVELAAECGDSTAIYARATWFLFGYPEVGVRRDLRKGMQLLHTAAKNSPHAMYSLGVLYANGANGLRVDEKKAFALFVRSAELGCLAAMKMRAYFLGSGQGVKPNPRKATVLLAHAEKLQKRLGSIHPDPSAHTTWE